MIVFVFFRPSRSKASAELGNLERHRSGGISDGGNLSQKRRLFGHHLDDEIAISHNYCKLVVEFMSRRGRAGVTSRSLSHGAPFLSHPS